MVLVQVRGGGHRRHRLDLRPRPPARAVDQRHARPWSSGRTRCDVGGAWSRPWSGRSATPAGPGVGYAISAVDCALWDLKARLLDLPLHRLLGAVRDEVPVYGSGGFTTYDERQLRDQLTAGSTQGIPRVKIKIGESWGTDAGPRPRPDAPGPGDDRHGRRAVRRRQRRLRPQAGHPGHARRPPTSTCAGSRSRSSSDDLDGLREVRDAVTRTSPPGSTATTCSTSARMCAAGAVDCLQVDVSRCGGITEWLRVAAVAASYGLEVSGHCAPHLHAHVAAATPNLRHLEWFHDHVRIESMFFDGTLDPAGGSHPPRPTTPGNGLTLRTADAEAFRVR